MAIDFDGSDDIIVWNNVKDLADGPFTVCAWINPDDSDNNIGYVFHNQRTGNTDYGNILWARGSFTPGSFTLTVNNASIYRYSNNVLTDGVWQHILATWDGTITDIFGVSLYYNGSEVTYAGGEFNVWQAVTNGGSWTVGARSYDTTRNFNGKVSEVGVWDRVISQEEISALASGFSPDFFMRNLVFYAPLVGPVRDLKTGTVPSSTTGTSVFNHNRIVRRCRAPITSVTKSKPIASSIYIG